jgi:short-subunit dehydrogenase
MKELRGTNALVTGASRGIGVNIALKLADRGVNLALVARSAEGLQRVVKAVGERGVKAVALAADVGELEGLGRLVYRATQELGPLDLLVNNAGIIPAGKFHELGADEHERTFTVNLLAPIRLTHLVLPGMIARGQGHILNVASLAGMGAMAYCEAYSSSKHGLVGFSRSLRQTARAEGYPIGVSVVCPGFISDAGMFADMTEGTDLVAHNAVGTSFPETVAAACVDAIVRNRAEVIVNRRPIRPMMLLGIFSPAAVDWIFEKSGYLAWLGKLTAAMAAARAREKAASDRPEPAERPDRMAVV